MEDNGSCRVVQAACQTGEAIENEAMLQKFLEKTKKKTTRSMDPEGESDLQTSEGHPKEEQEKLRKRVSSLMKKQKVLQVRGLMMAQDESKHWGQENHVNIGCRLIQLLMETAYIQPPIDQLGDGPPDIRPAFTHVLKMLTKDAQKGSRRYRVIECDSLVRKGLERSAKHMVIPYMPMLVPPVKWTGYDKGAYVFLPSYVMHTHGARQQRETIKRTPTDQLQRVFEVPLPEKPDTDDESVLRKWKWKVKAMKKENTKRHSQRCDVEVKLVVARKMKDEEGFFYPHSLDFHGRAYPMHPYINHLGSDLCRGILEFAEGHSLGKSGLRWLKIQLANLYAAGVDKQSYEDRIAFTEKHLDEIFNSADRPLEGRRW